MIVIKNKKMLFALPIILVSMLGSNVFAQAASYYESHYSESCGCYLPGPGSEVTGSISTGMSGVVIANADMESGTVSGSVVSPGGGGGGGSTYGGSIVPPMQDGVGGMGGPDMIVQAATPTNDMVPTMPNTALGDDAMLFYILLALAILFGEMLVLSYRFYRKLYR